MSQLSSLTDQAGARGKGCDDCRDQPTFQVRVDVYVLFPILRRPSFALSTTRGRRRALMSSLEPNKSCITATA
jgi:hypothetical protein